MSSESKLLKWKCLLVMLLAGFISFAQNKKGLCIVLIRHAQKPVTGNNLSCLGYNRPIALSGVLSKKYGIPDRVYVPSVSMGKTTTRVRMLETVISLAIRYNLTVNSKFDLNDKMDLASPC